MIEVTRKSKLTGKVHTRKIDITREQLKEYEQSDEYIQHFFPDLSADDREFIMTGITPEEWDKVFG